MLHASLNASWNWFLCIYFTAFFCDKASDQSVYWVDSMKVEIICSSHY